MKQKDYERAAELLRKDCETSQGDACAESAHAIDTFVLFFQENPKFDEKRFREACMRRCDRIERKWGKPCTKHEDHDGKCNS